ncbi:hypothetical protein [Sutcliffiella cohnii]|uniref:hypothetical protein n=1 Tax=Sutcliffiella cohnii TaxID=33932 RepID=UPI002E204B58|nr:hypothetical protein [Sutcliffiella cohnii]
MKFYNVRYGFYILALLISVLLIFIPLMGDYSVNAFVSKTFISVPIVLIIAGKVLAILEKRREKRSVVKDVSINIGLTIALVLFVIN